MLSFALFCNEAAGDFVKSPKLTQGWLNLLKDLEHQGGQGTGSQELLDVGFFRDAHRKETSLLHMEVVCPMVKGMQSGVRKAWI